MTRRASLFSGSSPTEADQLEQSCLGKNQQFVTTRFLCITAVGGCALLTICPTRPITGGELTEAQSASTGEPARKEISPAALVGLDEQQTTELLGPATTTESRAPASVWHYKNSRCELDLVFYMEMRTGLMRSLHYDFKNGAGGIVLAGMPHRRMDGTLPSHFAIIQAGLPRTLR